MNSIIAYITDLHLNEDFPNKLGVDFKKNWERIISDIKDRNIHEVVFGGDIGDKSAHYYFFESLKDFKLEISLGNHDNYNEVKSFIENFDISKKTALYYSKNHDHYKCIYLDSSKEIIDKVQMDWLREELVTSKMVLLFVHHPILEVNALVDKQFALKDRKGVKYELQKINNKVIVFSGHYHFEDITREANIKQYVTAASSYQVEKIPDEIELSTATFGYRIIEITPTSVITKQILFSN